MRHGRTPLLVRWLVLVALLVPVPASALGGEVAVPDSRLGTRIAPLVLLGRPDIRADLQLSPDQETSARQALEQLYQRALALRNRENSPEVISARAAIDRAQEDWMTEHLSVEQRTRLVQIDLQWEGPSALITRPLVAEALALTPEQRRTLAEAVAQRRSDRAQGKTQRADERPLAETVLATLSPEQRRGWLAMCGRPFVPQAASATPPVPATDHQTR